MAQQNRGAWPSGLSQNAALGNVNNAGISTKPDGTLYTGQNPFFGPAVIPASPLPPSSLSFGDVRWQPDSSWQYNVQVQRDLGQIGIASLGYVGSHTEHTTSRIRTTLRLFLHRLLALHRVAIARTRYLAVARRIC